MQEIEKITESYLTQLTFSLKQAITIKGKKTLKKQDILDLKQDETFWEV